MQSVIIVIHLMVVTAMVGMVLLQRSEGGGLGMGGGSGFLSSRGTANVLTRTTAILAAVFFATSLSLAIVAGWDRKPHSILEGTSPPQQQARPRTARCRKVSFSPSSACSSAAPRSRAASHPHGRPR